MKSSLVCQPSRSFTGATIDAVMPCAFAWLRSALCKRPCYAR